MTQRQLHRRVLLWQRRLAQLGVGHWRVHTKLLDKIDTDDDSNPLAEANPDAKYDSVVFSFTRDALKEVDDLDELIVHEWLHVVDRTQDEIVHGLLDLLPAVGRGLTVDREEAARERRVENLARLIVKLVESAQLDKET